MAIVSSAMCSTVFQYQLVRAERGIVSKVAAKYDWIATVTCLIKVDFGSSLRLCAAYCLIQMQYLIEGTLANWLRNFYVLSWAPCPLIMQRAFYVLSFLFGFLS